MNGSVRTRTVATVVAAPLAAVLLLAGCSAAGSSTSSSGVGGAAEPAPAPADGAAGAFAQPGVATAKPLAPAADSQAGAGTGTSRQADLLTGRSVIRTAAVSVRVDDVLAASARASALVGADGGFVAGEQTRAEPDRPGKAEAVLTLRVPASRLPELVTQLRALGTLLGETQDAQDVTGQVIDVKARISAQRASVARIQTLLAKANTIGQVVQIEGELTARQAALESLEGQAAALADQTALATVTATLVGPNAPVAVVTATPTGFGSGLSRGWHAFTTAGAWLLTALGTLLPFLLVLLPLGLVLWLARRRRPQPQPAAADPAPAPAA